MTADQLIERLLSPYAWLEYIIPAVVLFTLGYCTRRLGPWMLGKLSMTWAERKAAFIQARNAATEAAASSEMAWLGLRLEIVDRRQMANLAVIVSMYLAGVSQLASFRGKNKAFVASSIAAQ